MARFPQVDWVAVNGQDTPFTKPQHYKKGSKTDTELTGHDNPFPVAGYGMTEGGLWVPRRVDDEGRTLTQLTGSNVAEEFMERIVFDGTGRRDYALTVPSSAKGAVVRLNIFGAVGDYSRGGLRAKLAIGNLVRGAFLELETNENYGAFMFYLYPGITRESDLDTTQENVQIAISPYPIPADVLYLRLYMDGDPNPENEEGYDIDGRVNWIG